MTKELNQNLSKLQRDQILSPSKTTQHLPILYLMQNVVLPSMEYFKEVKEVNTLLKLAELKEVTYTISPALFLSMDMDTRN